MIICGGDSFSKFNTPMGNGEQQHGYSAVELLMDKFNTTGTCVGWSGASIDATVAKAIHYINNHDNIKLLFFYLTANVRIMYSPKITDDYDYANNEYNDPGFFDDQVVTNVHSNDGKGITPEAYKYFQHQPTYKKYYDRYAYINFLTNVCKNRGIDVLYVYTTDNKLDSNLLLESSPGYNNVDHVRFIDIDIPPGMYREVDFIKRRVGKTLLFVLGVFIGCDLNVPEKWETPQWYLPLTMPLIDQIMGFEGLLQGDVLTVDTTTSQIQIEFPGELDPQGLPDTIFNISLGVDFEGEFSQDPIDLDADGDGKIIDYSLPSQDIDLSTPLLSLVDGVEAIGIDFTCFSPSLLNDPSFAENLNQNI